METRFNRFTAFAVSVLLIWLIAVSVGVFFSTDGLAQEISTSVDLNPPAGETLAAVIPCTGMIDNALYESIKRRTNEAVDAGATYLIYEIQTYGGLVQAADDISKYWILEVGKEHKTVAYVTTEAISAGAMISVACKDIIMKENTTIGDSAPIVMGDKLEGVEREKIETFIRATFSRAAEANGYPEALLRAMVTQKLEVYQVKNVKTGKFEYFESKRLPNDEDTYDLENKKLVVDEHEILTLTANKAKEYGIAREVVKDFDEALKFLEKRDGVKFAAETLRLETNWSERMVSFLTSPVVSSILVLGLLMGAYVEFRTPGLGLPGLVAVICLVLLIGSKYLVGMANWIEIAVFLIGIILLAIELFVIPGFGIAGFSGILCIMLGLFGMLIKNRPDEIPWPDDPVSWRLFMDQLTGLTAGFLGFLVIAIGLTRYLPKRTFKGLVLIDANRGEKLSISATGGTREGGPSVEVGQTGEVVSALRPAGQANFDGLVVDVVSQGEFIEKGTQIQVHAIRGNRVVVRACT